MKTFASFALAGVLVLLSVSANAAVWRVNNNPVVNANFNNIASAISVAAVGDTIYLEGSVTNYGGINLNKRLTILGTGYFLAENDTTQAYLEPSRVNSLTFNTGSQGSRVAGLEIIGCTGVLVQINVNDVVLERNLIYQNCFGGSLSSPWAAVRVSSNRDNVTIRENFIRHDPGTSTSTANICIDIQPGATNTYVFNNIVKLGVKTTNYTSGTQRAFRMANNATAIISNNVFMGRLEVFNSVFTNNIQIIGFTTASGSFSGINNILIANNIGHIDQFGSDNGNQSNVNMATVFTYGPGGEDVDNHYQLLAGSPALGAGVSGVDAGAFGGDEPYYLSGIPAIPAVFEATIPTIVTTASGLNINTKIKAHD